VLFGRIEYIQIVNKGKTVMVNLEHSNQKLIEIRANVKKLTYQDLSSKKMAGYDVITSTQHAWEHIFLKDKFITVCEMNRLVTSYLASLVSLFIYSKFITHHYLIITIRSNCLRDKMVCTFFYF
jgi:hypothetical protein